MVFMIHIMRYLIGFITPLLLLTPAALLAMELQDINIPGPIKNAYKLRNIAPNTCITNTQAYLQRANILDANSEFIGDETTQLNNNTTVSIQLLAFCYAQIEEYQQSYLLLTRLLKQQEFSTTQLRTLDMLATEIPQEKRPEINNQHLIKLLAENLQRIQESPLPKTPNIKIKLLLSQSKLSLENNKFRDAYLTLEEAKDLLENNESNQLHAWKNYYYGLYYTKINQQQLAIAHLFAANKLANKQNFIKLSSETKNSLAKLYEQKHLYNRAIEFSSQRVELYVENKNNIKQARSLIQLAILKGKNKEQNEALIYLFNALELIQDKKNSILLAQIYLELGRVYSSYVKDDKNKKERLLAQKYLQNARFQFTNLGDFRYQIESLLLLARLNIISRDPALAIVQLENALRLASDSYPELSSIAFEMLASSYELTGNHQQAIVHFKNFHALQNNIKEHLFTLQQLQISEQLHLVESTQQKRYLEIENNELKKDNFQFKTISYGSAILLIMTGISLLYLLRRNQKLTESESSLQKRLTQHPRTKLPSQQAQKDEFKYDYNEIPLYYALVNISFLTNLNEISGVFSGAQIEEKLGQSLLTFFSYSSDIYQLRDNQILFISEQNNFNSAQSFVQKIELFFEVFAEQHNLSSEVAIGLVAFPFLNNASRAITPTRMLDLVSLALFGAGQLRDSYQTSSWLELYAIDNLQPAFFDGDLWVLGQKAIQKGIVKVNCNYQTHQFHWPELNK